MYKTIGIGAQLSAGKDSLADYLVKQLNFLNEDFLQLWVRNAFANKVKEIFSLTFGKTREWIEEWKRIEEPPPGFIKNVRQCLIGIGDGFRQMNPNIWIELGFRDQISHQIISDVRYVNEYDSIRERGGINILMWRKGYENDLPNASEQELMPFVRECLRQGVEGLVANMPFDLFIRNEGSLEDLYRKADTIVVPFIQRRYPDLFKKTTLRFPSEQIAEIMIGEERKSY